MIYLNFESISVPIINGNQSPVEFYKNKYQNHFSCNFGYKLVSANNRLNKLFKYYLGQGIVYKFITNFVKENKYCSRTIKKNLLSLMKVMKILKALHNVGFLIRLFLKVMLD